MNAASDADTAPAARSKSALGRTIPFGENDCDCWNGLIFPREASASGCRRNPLACCATCFVRSLLVARQLDQGKVTEREWRSSAHTGGDGTDALRAATGSTRSCELSGVAISRSGGLQPNAELRGVAQLEVIAPSGEPLL